MRAFFAAGWPFPRHHSSGPTAAEASRKLKSWGSQMELANELEKGLSISHSSAADESELLDDDALSRMAPGQVVQDEVKSCILLDALVSPSELFGTSVETVVRKFGKWRSAPQLLSPSCPAGPGPSLKPQRGLACPSLRIWDETRRRAPPLVFPLPRGVERGGGMRLEKGGVTSEKWSRTSTLSVVLEFQRLTKMCFPTVWWGPDARYSWPWSWIHDVFCRTLSSASLMVPLRGWLETWRQTRLEASAPLSSV